MEETSLRALADWIPRRGRQYALTPLILTALLLDFHTRTPDTALSQVCLGLTHRRLSPGCRYSVIVLDGAPRHANCSDDLPLSILDRDTTRKGDQTVV